MPESLETPARKQRMPPLAEIRLKNFKAVADETVELGMLTVIVGKNSAGKSTLLQSILVLKQTIASRDSSPVFPLNGDHVRLGTFDEVMNWGNGTGLNHIAIGFKIATSSSAQRRSIKSGRSLFSAAPRDLLSRVYPYQTVSWSGEFSSPEVRSDGFAILESFNLNVEQFHKHKELDSEHLAKRLSLMVSSITDSSRADTNQDADFFGNSPDASLAKGILSVEVNGETLVSPIDRIRINGGLPVNALVETTQLHVRLKRWLRLTEQIAGAIGAERKGLSGSIVSSVADKTRKKPTEYYFELIASWAATFLSAEYAGEEQDAHQAPLRASALHGDHERIFATFEKHVADMSRGERIQLNEAFETIHNSDVYGRVRRLLEGEKWIDELELEEPFGRWETTAKMPLNRTIDLELAVRVAARIFYGVQYLGPLREIPRVFYDPKAGQVVLGSKGEFTAAVLHDQARRLILAPLPGGRTERLGLAEAVNIWLIEMGLADDAKTADRGRLGIGLTVSPIGTGRDVDLTSVGVGVSQVLPVLVLCLLATQESVILLEQPELHLHPALQVRLADFLLACAESGRQMIIETHSEHLVNRLRLKVAQDETNETGELVQLLFAEQEEGSTSYRPSRINPLGGLDEEWPRGFLDVGAKEAGELLRQTVRRQRKFSAESD